MNFSGYSSGQMYYFKKDGVNIVCHGAMYDFSENENYSKAFALANEDTKEMYYANQQEELAEREEMLEMGDISDYSEYIGNYLDDYDPARFEKHIKETANKYICNLYDIPNKVVVNIPYETAKEMEWTDGTIKKALEDKYGITVLSQGKVDVATVNDVLNQKSLDAVHNTIEGSDYKTFLNLKANFENYSCNNVGLVYAQRPDAECIKGKKAWLALDREVPKGADPINILAPNFLVLTNEEAVEKYAEKKNLSDDEKNRLLERLATNGEVQMLTYYSSISVYDIKQTIALNEKGEDIEHLLKLNKPLKENAENFNEVSSAMKNIDFSIGKNDDSASYPFIMINNAEMSEQERLYQSVHNYAEQIFSENPSIITGIKNIMPSENQIHKMEVAISAYLVCKHIGIECEDKLALEISHTMNTIDTDAMRIGRTKMFEDSFDRASAFAKEFNKNFDKHYEKESKESEKQQKPKTKDKSSVLDR